LEKATNVKVKTARKSYLTRAGRKSQAIFRGKDFLNAEKAGSVSANNPDNQLLIMAKLKLMLFE
jgi:hypothetical protein